jgi:hypothetical protein
LGYHHQYSKGWYREEGIDYTHDDSVQKAAVTT